MARTNMNHIDLNSYFADMSSLPRSTTLLREDGLRCLLLHLKPGEEIPEHQTRGAITVHCLTGQSTFLANADRADLVPHSLISVPAGTPHSVRAQQETLLLVTVSEQTSAQ
jgi:quercetin dioxygenase-like cupin family protein